MERVTPVPRAEGDTLRDCRADTVQASISIAELVAGCWEGGGTEEYIAMLKIGLPATATVDGERETDSRCRLRASVDARRSR